MKEEDLLKELDALHKEEKKQTHSFPFFEIAAVATLIGAVIAFFYF